MWVKWVSGQGELGAVGSLQFSEVAKIELRNWLIALFVENCCFGEQLISLVFGSAVQVFHSNMVVAFSALCKYCHTR